MQRKLIALYVATALATMAGCGVGDPKKPHVVQPDRVGYLCVNGFVYVRVGHGLAPMFDQISAKPVRCPQQ